MNTGEIEPSVLRGPHRAERDGGPRRAGELRLPVCASVTFSRRELDRILRLYGRKVAAGEWRDYTIDFLNDRAVFSVFVIPARSRSTASRKIRGLSAVRAPTA